MAVRDPVRFVIVAIGGEYLDSARQLADSLQNCTFGYTAVVYAHPAARVAKLEHVKSNLPANGFSKLQAMRDQLVRADPDVLHVCIDADMQVCAPLFLRDLLPADPVGIFCVRHFLPPSRELWNVSPTCSAWTPDNLWAPVYWQTCLFGGFPRTLMPLLQRVNNRMGQSATFEGAWEEPFLNAEFCAMAAEGKHITTLGCEFAAPVWRPTQPEAWRQAYVRACNARDARILHHNHSRRGG